MTEQDKTCSTLVHRGGTYVYIWNLMVTRCGNCGRDIHDLGRIGLLLT